MRVLVADAGGALAASAVLALSPWGHEVEVARDGLEALRKARAANPHLVLARSGLGRLSALRLLSALRAGGGDLARAAFALVAGEGEGHLREEARRLGAIALLEAPLAASDLMRLVDRVEVARGGGARGPVATQA